MVFLKQRRRATSSSSHHAIEEEEDDSPKGKSKSPLLRKGNQNEGYLSLMFRLQRSAKRWMHTKDRTTVLVAAILVGVFLCLALALSRKLPWVPDFGGADARWVRAMSSSLRISQRYNPPKISLVVHMTDSDQVVPPARHGRRADFASLEMKFWDPIRDAKTATNKKRGGRTRRNDDVSPSDPQKWVPTRQIWDYTAGPGPKYRDKKHEQHHDFYFAQDDDYERTPYHTDDDEYRRIKPDYSCQNSHVEKKLEFPVCNKFHELDLNDYLLSGLSRFLDEGSFRETLVVDTRQRQSDAFVVKFATMDNEDFTFKEMHDYRQDGVVYAAIGPHPLLVDVYGYCSVGLLSEYMDGGTMEDALGLKDRCHEKPHVTIPLEKPNTQSKTVYSRSPFTAIEKLEHALDMSKALALLHNNRFGVIVHDDIKLDQFLMTTTTTKSNKDHVRVKLNDFNRAEGMMYDHKHQEYCKYRNGEGRGDWRSPEEYMDAPLDEMIDIYSMGNNFFSILTGEFLFPNTCNDKKVKRRIKQGERCFLDPRWANVSHAEGQLVHVIEKCWEQDPKNRYTIGQIITVLEKALEKQLQIDKQKLENTLRDMHAGHGPDKRRTR